MREPPVVFLTLSEAPPRSNLTMLEGMLETDGPKTAVDAFRDLADGWALTVYATGDGDLLVNPAHWRLGREILTGDRAARAERRANTAKTGAHAGRESGAKGA
jgi:hypothetical protein